LSQRPPPCQGSSPSGPTSSGRKRRGMTDCTNLKSPPGQLFVRRWPCHANPLSTSRMKRVHERQGSPCERRVDDVSSREILICADLVVATLDHDEFVRSDDADYEITCTGRPSHLTALDSEVARDRRLGVVHRPTTSDEVDNPAIVGNWRRSTALTLHPAADRVHVGPEVERIRPRSGVHHLELGDLSERRDASDLNSAISHRPRDGRKTPRSRAGCDRQLSVRDGQSGGHGGVKIAAHFLATDERPHNSGPSGGAEGTRTPDPHTASAGDWSNSMLARVAGRHHIPVITRIHASSCHPMSRRAAQCPVTNE
jgi:hypothetical protein